MKTRRLDLKVEEDTYTALRAQAYEQGISIGELVRRAIGECLAKTKPPAKKPQQG